MKLLRSIGFLVVAVSTGGYALGWDGYDYEKGAAIEIEKGNLVRDGEEIEYYDYGAGAYRTGVVESVQRSGSGVAVEVYDNESWGYRTFEMEE